MTTLSRLTGVGVATLALTAALGALANPTNVTVTPPDGARFAPGQRFDLRVEGKPASGSITAATFAIDGAPVTPSSSDSASGYTGYNFRGYSNATVGIHTLTATLTDGSGTTTATASFEIVPISGQNRPTRNIIILLGDGMGTAHRTAARIVRYGVKGGRPQGFLAMDQLPGSGFIATASLNSIITDSAPGMSCYVSGNHNNNGQEGVFPAHLSNVFAYPRVEYLSEYLHRTQGKSLGLISTADIEDATPAANAVHTGNRGAGQGICDQYLDERGNTGLTVLMGGGRRWFLPAGQFGSSRSKSNDYAALPSDLTTAWGIPAGTVDPNRDLIGDFQAAGFSYASDNASLNAAFSGGTPSKLLGLFGYGNMNVSFDKIAHRRSPSASDIVSDYHAPDQPLLDEMTAKGLQVLNQNPNGFVLTVEGAHIDKQSHFMDADRAIWDAIEFDRAVQVARSFADQVGDTTVIVLADHECSGFSIIGALNGPNGVAGSIDNLKSLPSDARNFRPARPAVTDSAGHVIDPGNPSPARQGVVGTYDAAGFPQYTILGDGFPATADIDGKLLIGFGANADRYEGWLSKPLPVIDSLLPSDIKTELAGKGYASRPDQRAEAALGFFVRGQVPGDQAVHTASDIPVTSYSTAQPGVASNAYKQFYGVQENTDVFFKLLRAANGGY